MQRRRAAVTGTLVAVAVAAVLVTAGAASTSIGAATPPTSLTAPSIVGTAREGQLLRVHRGRWRSGSPIGFSYQWQLCRSGTACTDIQGATARSYAVRHSDVGGSIQVVVTATNATGSRSAPTAATAAIAAVPAGAPVASARPTIGGKTQPGTTLTAGRGTWAGAPAIKIRLSWWRCGPHGGACRDLGRHTQTYDPARRDLGHTFRILVRARNRLGTSVALSDPTTLVAVAAPPTTTTTTTTTTTMSAPANTSPPTLSGSTQQGQKLTGHRGSWNSAADYDYFWTRCDKNGNNCANINKATHASYTLTSADVGHTIRFKVMAKNGRGDTLALSVPTAVIAPAQTRTATAVAVSSVALPDRLVVDRVKFVPKRIHSRGVPLVARFHVSEVEHGKAVAGAMVRAIGVPFNRLSATPEVQTGPNGWAEVSFRVLPTFPLRPGNFVVVFVRARKPGGSVLAGVSTRRLVSVRVR
jgi:hypothetical protein